MDVRNGRGGRWGFWPRVPASVTLWEREVVFGRLYAAGKPVNREWLDRENIWIVLTRIVTRKTVVLWLTVKVRDTQCLEANETKPNSIVL